MLNLRREVSETILIDTPTGELITIKVLKGKTRLGITAPQTYRILRCECLDQPNRKGQQAEASQGPGEAA